jgi:hypothetical protein
VTRRRVLLGAAACALLATLGWLVVRRSSAPPDRGRAPSAAPACDCEGSAGTSAQAPSIERAEPVDRDRNQPAESTVEAARFAVCEREETRAALSRVPLLGDRAELWALHCGRSVHLIAIETLGSALVPRRVAMLEIPRPGAAEASVAVDTAAADVNGDGRADWIAPVLLADASGVPRGGGLYVLLQRAEGGFVSPTRLLAAAPGQLVAAELDAQPGQDLVLLQRENASAGRPDELWLIHGGAAPLRAAQRPASVATNAIAALDLDLDEHDDLAVASAHDGRIQLWLSRAGALATVAPVDVMMAGVEQLLPADVDGDGVRELVLAGERVWVLPTTSDTAATRQAVAIAGSDGMRDVHLADANGDAQPELVGYAHPDLVALLRVGDRFERSRMLSLRGDVSVLFVRVAQFDHDPRPDLLLMVLSADGGRQVEVSVARNLAAGATVRFAAKSAPIADSALLERFVLP